MLVSRKGVSNKNTEPIYAVFSSEKDELESGKGTNDKTHLRESMHTSVRTIWLTSIISLLAEKDMFYK